MGRVVPSNEKVPDLPRSSKGATSSSPQPIATKPSVTPIDVLSLNSSQTRNLVISLQEDLDQIFSFLKKFDKKLFKQFKEIFTESKEVIKGSFIKKPNVAALIQKLLSVSDKIKMPGGLKLLQQQYAELVQQQKGAITRLEPGLFLQKRKGLQQQITALISSDKKLGPILHAIKVLQRLPMFFERQIEDPAWQNIFFVIHEEKFVPVYMNEEHSQRQKKEEENHRCRLILELPLAKRVEIKINEQKDKGAIDLSVEELRACVMMEQDSSELIEALEEKQKKPYSVKVHTTVVSDLSVADDKFTHVDIKI